MSNIEILFLILIIGSVLGIGWQLLARKKEVEVVNRRPAAAQGSSRCRIATVLIKGQKGSSLSCA